MAEFRKNFFLVCIFAVLINISVAFAEDVTPKDAESYFKRGVVYEEKREFEKAIADYNKAIELNPNYAEAYNRLGNAEKDCYYSRNSFPSVEPMYKAIERYNKAIELNPNLAEAYYNRGNTYKYFVDDYSRRSSIYKLISVLSYFENKKYKAIVEADFMKAAQLDPQYKH